MAYDFHYTPTGTGVISGKEVLEQTEDAINDLGNTAISGVQEALDKAEQALTNSANAVDDAQTALNTANNAEGVAIQAQTDVSNLSGTVTNIGNRVTTAEGNISNLQGRMTTAEGNITNLQGRMTTAETNIGNLQTAVSTAQATANSAQQTATTARQQSYVFRYSSTALVASSTNSNTLLDNTDNLKVGDKVIDSNGVLFSVTAIDTANSTFTVGSALVDLALDANVVHTSGNETVTGVKSFSDDTYIKTLNFTNEVPSQSSSSSSIMPIIATITYGDSSPAQSARLNLRITADGTKSLYPHENSAYSLGLASRSWSDFYTYHGYFHGQQQNDEYSSNARTNLTLLANRDALGQSGCVVDTFRENTTQGTGMHILGFGMKENSVRYEGCRLQWQYDSTNLGYNFNLKPNVQGNNVPLTYNLGTSSDRWNSVYSLNYYYGSNNTEFSDKFVTTDTSQTITGAKTWVSAQVWSVNCQRRMTNAIEKGDVPSTSVARNDYYTLKNGGTTYADALGVFGCLIDNNAVSTYFHAIKNVAGSTTRTTLSVKYYTNTNEKTIETNGDIIPTGSSQNLGNSTSKWATINGLEPSALGMPSDTYVDISGYVTDLTGGNNLYTAPANGIIAVDISGTNRYVLYNNNLSFGDRLTGTNFRRAGIIQVRKNDAVIIQSDGGTLNYAKFYPCQGNI